MKVHPFSNKEYNKLTLSAVAQFPPISFDILDEEDRWKGLGKPRYK